MSTQLDTREDHLTGLSTIEGIDLDLEVKCEDPSEDHDHAADVLTTFKCPRCGARRTRPRCWPVTRHHLADGTYCSDCLRGHGLLVVIEHLR